jgi:tetratricopeptide (TPR) repeat protein
LVQQHRLPEATAELTQAVKAAPRDVAIRRAVVRTDLLAGNAGAAQQALQELDALAPSDPADLFLAGLVAEAEHREADAAMAYDEMLSSNAEAPEALTAWARVELAQGHQVAARMRVLAYTRFSPMNAEALGLLGELYLAQANYAQAIQSLTRAIQLAPTLASAYRALAAAQLRQGNPSAATNTYERAVAAIGPEPGLVSELAALDERQGRIENALSLYEDLVRRLPGQTVAARNLALLLCRYRRDPVSLDRALQLTASFATSGNPTLVDAAGWVHFKRNETQQALTDLERAATLAPNERVIQYHLGMVQLQAGQRDLARASLKAALAGAARFVGIDQARATLRELDSH